MEAFQIDHFQFHLPVEPSAHRARIHGTFPGYFGYSVKSFYLFENKSRGGAFGHTPLPKRETFLHYAKLFPFLSRAAVKLCPFDGSSKARPDNDAGVSADLARAVMSHVKIQPKGAAESHGKI
jgi:hypothetical protein